PLGTVGVMPAPVGDLTAGVVEDPAEVDVAPRGGVGSGGRRAKPGVVFKTLRHRLGPLPVRRLGQVGTATRLAHANGLEIADPAVANQLASAAEVVVGPLLAARLEDHVVLANRVAHGAALDDGERQGLLAVDVFPRLAGLDHRDRVPVVRCADLDGVDIVAAQDLAEIDACVAAAIGPGELVRGVMLLDQTLRRGTPADFAVPVSGALAV